MRQKASAGGNCIPVFAIAYFHDKIPSDLVLVEHSVCAAFSSKQRASDSIIATLFFRNLSELALLNMKAIIWV